MCVMIIFGGTSTRVYTLTGRLRVRLDERLATVGR